MIVVDSETIHQNFLNQIVQRENIDSKFNDFTKVQRSAT